MYTILIADPDLYAVGVFRTKEEAYVCIEKMKLPTDSLVIEIKESMT